MMSGSGELRRTLQGPVQLHLTSEVQHGNHIDCSVGGVFARRRRLGILSLARLVRSLERVTPLLDSICGVYEGLGYPIAPEPSFRFPELSQPTRSFLCLGSQESCVPHAFDCDSARSSATLQRERPSGLAGGTTSPGFRSTRLDLGMRS